MKRILMLALVGLALVLTSCSEDTPLQPAETNSLPTLSMQEITQLLETGRGEDHKARVLPSMIFVLGEGAIAYNHALSGDFLAADFTASAGEVFKYRFFWGEEIEGNDHLHYFGDRLINAPSPDTWSSVPVEPQEILATVQRVTAALGDPIQRVVSSGAYSDEAVLYWYSLLYLDEDGELREFVMFEARTYFE